ncbi:MAG: hypothetical protein FWE31_00825 [Firmicutes bacterium]|nr:hypothetical protein [Bacillota bacterium]
MELAEIKVFAGTDINEAIKQLQQDYRDGKNTYVNFNGVKLFARDNPDEEAYYFGLTGKTKEEREAQAEAWRQQNLKPPNYNSEIPFLSSDQEIQQQLEMLVFLKPLIKALADRPLPLPPGKEVKLCPGDSFEKNESVEGGFSETWRQSENVLLAISPLLAKKHDELLRSSGFRINLDDKSTAHIYGDRDEKKFIDIGINNNPSDIRSIAHEVAHHVCPLEYFDQFLELPAILVEVLASDELARRGIKSDAHKNYRFNTMNTHNEELLATLGLVELFDKTGLNGKELARDIPMQTILDEYNSSNDTGENELFQRISRNVSQSDRTTLMRQFLDAMNNQSGFFAYYCGQFFASIFAQKIRQGTISLENVLKVIGNDKLPPLARLKQLGITEITPEMIKPLYDYAQEHYLANESKALIF